MARLAGVSTSTVSYLLSGRPARQQEFPAATRARVNDAARRLGYVTNHQARALRRQKAELIGIVYIPPVTPWFDSFSVRAREHLASRGYGLVQIPFEAGATAAPTQMFASGFLDGAIAFCDDADNNELIAQARAHRVPITVFSDTIVTPDADVVHEHRRDSVAETVDYLVARGKHRIAFLDARSHDADSREADAPDPKGQPADTPRAAGTAYNRLDGYVDGMRRHNLAPLVLSCPDTRTAAYDATITALAGGDAPDALIACTDRAAVSAIWAAHSVGVEIPRQLAIIGCGNSGEGRGTMPELTSLGLPTDNLATIVDHLLTRIDTPGTPGRRLSLPWTMFARGSA